MRVVSGTARGVVLRTPEGMSTRPTTDRVKESLFNIIQFDVPCSTVLDLFGGTGQLGIEALSRGAKSATFVDIQESACNLIRENLRRTHFSEQGRVVCSSYDRFLRNCKEKYDLILLDPPYAEVFLENALNFITEIDILQTGGIISTERPVGKALLASFPGYERSRDYKYGNTVLTLFRKSGHRKTSI